MKRTGFSLSPMLTADSQSRGIVLHCSYNLSPALRLRALF